MYTDWYVKAYFYKYTTEFSEWSNVCSNLILPVYKGVQTLGTTLSRQLHFIFVGHQYGTWWDLEFWSGFKISGNCVHPRLSKFTVYKSHGTSVLSCRSYNNYLPFYIRAVLHDLHFNYLQVPRETTVISLYNLRHIHKAYWKIADSSYSCFDNNTSKLSFHCTCTQNMCGNHSEW